MVIKMHKNNYKYLLLILFSVTSIIFVYNDYFLYRTPIIKVINIENKNNNNDNYYYQKITGKIMNGKYKGNIITLNNKYLGSLVYDDKIEKNDELLINLSNDGKSAINIENIKRDKYLVILLVIFIDLILLIAGYKGLQTLISLFVNVIISAISIIVFKNNFMTMNLLILYLFVSIIFIITSLYITNGKGKKTLCAIVSSIVSLFLSFTLSYLIIRCYGDNLYIWGMDYIEVVKDYHNFLYVSILLSGLGAIMDISITIASSLNELIEKDSKITKSSLIKSGKIISKDIVGTMINVMLFTCYTSVIPTVLLAVKNNMNIVNALDFYGNIEFCVVLCNCIGIVLAIPISLYISIFILNHKGGYKNE